MNDGEVPEQRAFFGSFPRRGIWTAVGLTRSQFLLVLALSVGLFVFADGPLWRHLHDSHFTRISVSYAVIPPAVIAALVYNRRARATLILGASAVIATAKLLLTALLLVAFGLAAG